MGLCSFSKRGKKAKRFVGKMEFIRSRGDKGKSRTTLQRHTKMRKGKPLWDHATNEISAKSLDLKWDWSDWHQSERLKKSKHKSSDGAIEQNHQIGKHNYRKREPKVKQRSAKNKKVSVKPSGRSAGMLDVPSDQIVFVKSPDIPIP